MNYNEYIDKTQNMIFQVMINILTKMKEKQIMK